MFTCTHVHVLTFISGLICLVLNTVGLASIGLSSNLKPLSKIKNFNRNFLTLKCFLISFSKLV